MYNLVPLKSQPNQSFDLTVEIDGVNKTYFMKLNYRDIIGYWTFDLIDYQTNEEILVNVPLLTGGKLISTANILNQLEYKRLGRIYIVKVSDTTNDYPDFESLETNFAFVWGDSVVS